MFALGVAAALTSPLVMTVGFILWQDHWKGSAFSLNLYKCNLASLGFLILSCTVTASHDGQLFPSDVFTAQAVGYLMLSSMIGIVIGDYAWLRGLQLLGARRTILMDSIKPFLASLFGYIFLDEKIRLAALGGIALTVAGVLLVSLESTKADADISDSAFADQVEETSVHLTNLTTHHPGQLEDDDNYLMQGPQNNELTNDGQSEDTETYTVVTKHRHHIDPIQRHPPSDDMESVNPLKQQTKHQQFCGTLKAGYCLSILNAIFDTYGAVLTKQYGVGMTVWEINLLRFGFAAAIMLVVSCCCYISTWPTTPVSDKPTTSVTIDEDAGELPGPTAWYALPREQMTRRNWLFVTGGVLLVTFAAPSLFNYSLFQIALALTLTLTSIGPIYSLPLGFLLQKEVPTWRAISGALLAVAGIVVLSFKGTISTT
jgi:drug/metabolite transporter (DMT)-like permease